MFPSFGDFRGHTWKVTDGMADEDGFVGHRLGLVPKAKSHDRHLSGQSRRARHPEEGFPHREIYGQKGRLGSRWLEFEWSLPEIEW
ncbi:hypothetical protein GCM10017710_20120 [Arthrobacter ramosus]